jgi:RNA polymerase sigma-70 factor, ECF subfamily
MDEVNPVRRLRSVVGASRARSGTTERDLLSRVARGDEAAFSDLYDLVAPRVHAVVLRVLRDPAQAEEVTQEVLVELWRLAPRFDDRRGSVAAWASTVAHRRAVDRVRSTQSARDRDQREIDAGTVGAPTDEVAELVEDRLERERVVRALGSLTPTQRESIELAYFSGYTYREVAAVLDVPEGTIKTRIRDGLIRLRDELEVSS